MSTKKFSHWFGSKESHPQPVPSPPSSPLPGRNPDFVKGEERIMSPEELQQSVESLEAVLRTMDALRDQTNRQNTALRDHARSLRGYAVNINMMATFDDRAPKKHIGEDKVFENLLVHCANYYDRLAEAQELFARKYLEEYNMLNNHAAKHFKKLARDSAKLDANLKDLTKKLSKLTHRSAPPGSATTQNVSTVQNAGIHELYVTKLTSLSGQIQNVRRDHLTEYTRVQKNVDRTVARSFARCCRESYTHLGDALTKTGGVEAIGGVTAWGIYANAGISPPMVDLENLGEMDINPEDEWDQSQEDEGEGLLSPRQIAAQQLPRPPTSFSDYSFLQGNERGQVYPAMSMNLQGKMPVRGSQHSFQPYPGSSQLRPVPSQHSQQYPTQVITDTISPEPVQTPHRVVSAQSPSTQPQHQQYAAMEGSATGVPNSRFQEHFSPQQ